MSFPKAQELTKERLRRDRALLLAEQDTLFMRALDPRQPHYQCRKKEITGYYKDSRRVQAIGGAEEFESVKVSPAYLPKRLIILPIPLLLLCVITNLL